MWISLAVLIASFVTLVWSADRFVSASASTADRFGVSKLVIGLTVVAVGTSAPEILVSVAAALDGHPILAIGNAVGSNIVNIGLVLGVTAMVAPLPFKPSVLKTELPWLIGTTFLALACLFNLYVGRLDGVLLLGGLGYLMWRLARASRTDSEFEESFEDELGELPVMSVKAGIVWIVVGLVILLISARLLVWSATNIAEFLGVSDLVIGLTVVALGTSLPELATTLGAAIKGHTDIAIGNVVGSNILNILGVLSVPALIAPTAIGSEVLWRDAGTMLALTLMLALFAYGIGSKPVITRFEGAVLCLAWIGYNMLLFHQT
ncbi:MAG: calcium/sodium antiporter [Gammaproteobacteria bacterium]|nr:calcium/sodium antiporter [Gammaproteobacteria bacterium]